MFNLANLALLQTGGSYETCKKKQFKEVMKEFKDKELKLRSGKPITDKKQAIAIALNKVDDKCSYTPSESDKLVSKVNDDLNDKSKEIILSNLVETKNAVEHLIKKGKSKRAWIFKKLLWDKIIDSQMKDKKLDKNMWEQIKEIHQL
jgi:hypothetical protein